MTSSDNYITIEMFNSGIQEIKSELKDIKTEIRYTNLRIDNMADRLEDLKFFGTVGLAIIAILIAIVALVPMFRRERTERSEDLSSRNIRDIRALIREEFNLLRNAELRV